MPDNTIYEDMENEDFYSYASPNYLGASGITLDCVNSMVAVLTSAIRPQKITMISLRTHYDHDSVMFFVWDWPSYGRGTIVPDGFGTHGGEGGRGLATVLGLIQFYNVPLKHAILFDEDMWSQLAEEGKLSPQLFDILVNARPYNWNYYRVDMGRMVKKGREISLELAYGGIHIPLPQKRK